MWVQLIKPHRIMDPGGRPVMHNPGEILHIKNKDKCRQLIRDGFAVDIADAVKYIPPGSGVLSRSKLPKKPHWIEALDLGLAFQKGPPSLPFALTILWNPRYVPNRAQLSGIFRVMRDYEWDVAVPIKSYDKLVKDVGSAEGRARTKKMIHNMRVPYYNTALVWCKRNERTEALMRAWGKEKAGGDETLAFMRAVYIVKPYLLPLPSNAVQRRTR